MGVRRPPMMNMKLKKVNFDQSSFGDGSENLGFISGTPAIIEVYRQNLIFRYVSYFSPNY